MKKIILSSIATITLTIGALIVINMNKQPETIDNTSPETVQSVIEHETVIDAPEEVEAAVEAVQHTAETEVEVTIPKEIEAVTEPAVKPVGAIETVETETVSRELTFDELVDKHRVDEADYRFSVLKIMYDNRIIYPERHPYRLSQDDQFKYFIRESRVNTLSND